MNFQSGTISTFFPNKSSSVDRSSAPGKDSRLSTETNAPSNLVEKTEHFLSSDEVEAILGNYMVHLGTFLS